MPEQETTTTVELVEFETLTTTEAGKYRVAFEGRTAWNGEFEITDQLDEQDEPYETYAIAWREPDVEDKHRVFTFIPDEDGHVIVDGKPKWGRLVKLVAKS